MIPNQIFEYRLRDNYVPSKARKWTFARKFPCFYGALTNNALEKTQRDIARTMKRTGLLYLVSIGHRNVPGFP